MGGEMEWHYFPVFKARFRHQLVLRGWLKDLSTQLNKSEGYLSNLLSEEAKLSMQGFFSLSRDLDIPIGVVFPLDDSSTFEAPVRVLLSQRENAVLPANAFLDELQPRLELLLQCAIERQAPTASERALLEALEEQRHADRRATQEAAEQLALKLADSLEVNPGPKPKRQVAELAGALALWATIQRTLGLRDLAARAFSFAFPVAKHSGDHWALGTCHQRASYVLRDLGRPDLGYEFLRHAIFYFSAEDTQLNSWKCHMDCGALLGAADRIEESNSAYELALEKLPGSEWRFRACSLQGLAVNARNAGNPEQARDYLVAAAKECRSRDLLYGHISWTLAKVEVALQNEKASSKFFHEAIGLLGRFGSAGDVGLAAVDYAEILLKLGKGDQVLGLATQVLKWLPKLRANLLLRRAFERLVELGRAARLDLIEFREVRGQIETACKQDPAQRPPAQPR